MLQIDKNVPMPDPNKANNANRSCWSDFEVGDSAFFEGQVAGGAKPKNGFGRSAYISAIKYGHRNKKRFSGRNVTENGKQGARIWRVA